MNNDLDPIKVDILWKRLVAAVDEAVTTLLRVSFSTVIRDFHDYACAIFDPEGRILAQSTHSTPGLLGVLPFTILNFLEHPLAADLKPGDVLLTNDPWLASGHLPDITVATPIFRGDKIVAYVLCTVHHINIGGRAGSLLSRDVYEEGLKIPIMKLYSEGVPVEPVFSFIRANVREADKVLGDLRAQVTANIAAGRKFLELLDYAGLETVKPLADQIIGRTEIALREALQSLPDMDSSASVLLNDVPGTSGPVKLALRIRKTGANIAFDFAGTSDQVPSAVNVVLNMTRSYCVYPLKCLLIPEIPSNAGLISVVQVEAPEGSILNAKFPAANWARSMVAHLLPELIMETMADILPDKLIAGSGATPLCTGYFSGRYRDGRSFYVIGTFNGGMGARKGRDGLSCITYPGSVANIPVEVIERDTPIVFERKSFAPNSAGPGRMIGGHGQKIVLTVPDDVGEVLKGPIIATIKGSRHGLPITGRGGGSDARPAEMIYNGRAIPFDCELELNAGDRLEIILAGGGGYGDPRERDNALIEQDLRDELLSPQEAEQAYGFSRVKTQASDLAVEPRAGGSAANATSSVRRS